MRWFVVFTVLLTACYGTLDVTPIHVVIYKTENGQFSCKGNSCCYPYKNSFMACTEETLQGPSIYLKYKTK